MPPAKQSGPQARHRTGAALAGLMGGYALGFILGGMGVGFLLDRVAHTFPAFFLVGVLVGFAASMVQIYRLAMQETNN